MNATTASATLNGSGLRQSEDPSSIYDERAAKRLHRATIGSESSWRPLPSAPAPQPTTTTVAGRRQSALRDQHKPLHGPRPPDFSASKSRVTSDSMTSQHSPTRRSFLPSSTTSEPFLGLSRRMTSNFDFGPPVGDPLATSTQPTEAHKPLYKRPSAESSLSTMPPPESIPTPVANYASNGSSIHNLNGSSTIPNIAPHSNRSSIRGSPSKQRNPALRAAQLSTASASGSTVSTPLTVRTRRQSQFPPTAANRIDPRLSRQSVGPDFTASTWTNYSTSRTAQLSANNLSIAENTSVRSTQDAAIGQVSLLDPSAGMEGGVTLPDGSSTTNSAQFPQKQIPGNQPNLRSATVASANGPTTDGEQVGTTKLRVRRLDPTTQAAVKRQTLGLARAVSPTDAKKSKRISALPPPIPTPNRSPSPVSALGPANQGLRASQHSPTPRPPTPPRPRHSPPSSFGTVSEANQSVIAGRSLSSRSSSNSLRPPSSGTSNPPSLFSTSFKQAGTKAKQVEKLKLEGLDTVPPVPAIPKAYESPNQSADEPFFSATESVDAISGTEGQAADTRVTNADRASPIKKQPRSRRRFTLGAKVGSDKNGDTNSSNREAQTQSRLPPLTLLPLSNPTSDKIASITLKNAQHASGKVTPSRPATAKTPTTPMTASRATFSNSGYQKLFDKETLTTGRPSTSGKQSANEPPRIQDFDKNSPTTFLTPSPPVDTPTNQTQSTLVTPVPSTVSGLGSEQEADAKSETQGDSRASRLAGFRSRAFSRSSKDPTPSQASNIDNNRSTPVGKRRLTLGFRRSSSKASHSHTNDETQDVDLLPPKLPAPSFSNEPLSLGLGNSEQQQAETLKIPTTTAKAPSSPRKPEVVIKANEKNANAIASDSSQKRLSGSEKQSSTSRTPMQRLMGHKVVQPPPAKSPNSQSPVPVGDALAEEEMKKLASKKKEFESAARSLDQLQQRASPKERVSPGQAAQVANLNIFERGEIIDYPDIFFCGLRDAKKCVGDLASQLSNFGFDDERGDYNIVVGDHLAYRYEVVDVLGKGSFGQVVRCIDHKHGKLVAVKIIRNKKRFHQQALVEVNLLQKLREWDPHKKHSNVEFTHHFYFRGHLCIATELLGMNLYEFIKAHDFHGFSLKLIRRFTQQMLASLCLLQNHSVIHCDLKPENILLVHPLHSEIKVIDFGSSCFENEKVYTYIQSRFYRSPEVILGMDYGMSIDMWSLGCILAELLTGYPIFPGENEQEQLACIMEIFGPPEKHLIERSSRKKLFFDSLGKPRVTVSSKGKRRRPSSKTLQQALKCDDDSFLDFITQCLRWDPERRLKPRAAMTHDFVTGVKSGKGKALTGSGASSPAKRPTTGVQTPSKLVRPLPEAPATAHKAGTATNSIGPNSSPLKTAIPPRRHSTLAGIQAGAAGVKRGPNGAIINSALPRSISGKPDLASAAAIASLQRQR